MLTSKIVTEILENHSEISGSRKAAVTMFRVDLD